MTQETEDNNTIQNMKEKKIGWIKELKVADILLDLKMTGEPVDKLFKVTEKIDEKDLFVEYKSSTKLSQYAKEETTGTEENIKEIKEIKVPFEKYIVTVGLSPTNEFLGITEIEIIEDFRSEREKIKSKPFYDVDEYYEE
ncbi:MAG: hypothetical protein ACFFDF_00980 [Candidatus Odinarchaeota archaeon]